MRGDDIKRFILDTVGPGWMDISVVVGGALSKRKLKLKCNHVDARIVASYLYELRVTGKLEVRQIGNGNGYDQVRRKLLD